MRKKIGDFHRPYTNVKEANLAIGPLLTNPLNSCTKLQRWATLQNIFFKPVNNFQREWRGVK